MTLTIKEVAQRLHLPIETVHRWIRQGKIPMQLNRGEYMIRSEMLERWAKEHKLGVVELSGNLKTADTDDFDSILAAMQRGGVFYDVAGQNREAVLRSAVELIPNIEPHERDLVYNTLIEREQLASTGIGNGIALPHPRSNPGIDLKLGQITTCFLTRAVDFDAIDARPVSILMVLLSRSTKQHVTMLSKLSYYLRNTAYRELLLMRPEAEQIFKALADMESKGD
jgi:PTS system nitrogen regulatory IIA component